MPANEKDEELRMGFLAAIQASQGGWVGGLLVTNRWGRPLEFQCTSPVKPNQTQKILYGPTLVPFILGELIGRTLVEKIGVRPHLILIEQADMLEVRNHVSLPVACLADRSRAIVPPETGSLIDSVPAESKRLSASETSGLEARTPFSAPRTSESPADLKGGPVSIGRQFLRFHAAHASDRELVASRVMSLPDQANLREPFSRVREALTEAVAQSRGTR